MISYLGLSIGATNVVASPPGDTPTIRRAVLTRFPHRPPEVGVPSENPRLDQPGLVLTGFVDRIGDPVPIVAPDGSTFNGERLAAEALEALVRSVSPIRPPDAMTVSVPAHWRDGMVSSLRSALAAHSVPSPGGTPVLLVSDSIAALTALQAQPGLPARGIVALCDFGGTGTSITLADAANGFRSIAPTVRFEDFSGDLIDQAVLRHVLADLNVDPSSTSAVVSLTYVRDQCRIAKERLSYDTATGFTGPLPGPQSTVRITRGELEALLHDPVEGVLAALDEELQRNNVGPGTLAAIATVGGGARIPYVTQRLSETLRIPIVTTSQPQAVAALGAAMIARRGPDEDVATRLGVAPAAAVAMAAPAAAASVEPLAWSEDQATDLIAEYHADDGDATDRARPQVQFMHGQDSAIADLPPLPVYRRPGVLFGAAAVAVLVAVVGLLITLRSGEVATTPAGVTGTTAPSAAPAQAPAPVSAPAPAPVQTPAPAPNTVVVQQQIPYQAPAPKVTQAPRIVQAPQQPAPAPEPPPPDTATAPPPAPEPPPPPPPSCGSLLCVPIPGCSPPLCVADPTPGTGTETGGTGTGTDTGTGTGGTGTDGTGTGTGTGGTGGTGTGGTGTGTGTTETGDSGTSSGSGG